MLIFTNLCTRYEYSVHWSERFVIPQSITIPNMFLCMLQSLLLFNRDNYFRSTKLTILLVPVHGIVKVFKFTSFKKNKRIHKLKKVPYKSHFLYKSYLQMTNYIIYSEKKKKSKKYVAYKLK